MIIGAVLGTLVPWAASAVVATDGNVAYRNTGTAGLTNDEIGLWEQLGTLNGFYVTPVSARHVLAAKHIGGMVGDTVSFGPGPNQGSYATVGFVDDPESDLRLWEIAGTLSAWVEIYTGSDERDATVTVFGLGGPPGVIVDVPTGIGPPPASLKGWEWSSPDGLGSWGRNVVDRTGFTSFSGLAIVIDFERPVFGGIAEECHVTGGDSSGPWFLQENGSWFLAGLNSLVSGPFQYSVAGQPSGQFFEASLFDKGGLWENDPAFLNADQFSDVPSSAFAVRVSSRQSWLLPLLDPDSDADGIPDSTDICPYAADPGQEDNGGVGTSAPDGIGDACQCGDVTADGIVSGTDATFITRQALGLFSPLFLVPGNCDVTGDGNCDGIDSIFVTRAALGLPAPLFGQNCPNALP